MWALGWWMPPLTSYVLPQCAGVWCAVWCVCGWVSPECAAVAQCPRVRASFAVYQCLREFTLRSFIRSLGSRLPIFAYVLMVDTTRCMLSPPSPAPLASVSYTHLTLPTTPYV